jgi:hypothetical protein
MPEPIDLDVARQRRRLVDAIAMVARQFEILGDDGPKLLAEYQARLAELRGEVR